MKARPERSTGADPQGAVARAEAWRAEDERTAAAARVADSRLAEAVAEARLVERARVVKWLREQPDDAGELADAIDNGEHLDAYLIPAARVPERLRRNFTDDEW